MDPEIAPTARGERGWSGLLLLALAFVIAPAIVTTPELRAQDTVMRQEGAPFLLLPVGARAVALGRAVTSLSSAEAAFWNPAGLARLEGNRVVLKRGEHITGDALGVSIYLRAGGRGVFGASYMLLDEGTQDATDADGNVIGSLTHRNHLVLLTAATTIAGRVDTGVNVKYPRFELGCRGQCPEGRVRSDSWAADIGVRARPFERFPVDFGASIVHLGRDFRNRAADEGAPLPTRFRVGISWEAWERFIEDERLSVLVALDVEDRLRDAGDPALFIGTEFAAGTEDRIYIRGGYSIGRSAGLEGGAAGFGIRYDRLELDLARALPRGAIASQQEPVHLTFAVRF